MRKFVITALLATSAIACNSAHDPANAENHHEMPSAEDALAKVLAADIREGDKARDQYRHPAETLAFFQVEPGQTVAEYAPGGGWYTRVLAPYVIDHGSYIALGVSPSSSAPEAERMAAMEKFAAETPASVEEETGIDAEKIHAFTPASAPAEWNGKVDRILIFRMMHNLMRRGLAAGEIAAMKTLLKPDGMIGIVQHRAKADAPADYVDGNKGYLKQDDIIAFMDEQGFELVGASEINANPKDSADWPNGVWTLPPTLRLKDQDRAKYEAIGESDRMTLLFRKKA
ncbi:MAG: methyltransferase [Blastomonas sp.]